MKLAQRSHLRCGFCETAGKTNSRHLFFVSHQNQAMWVAILVLIVMMLSVVVADNVDLEKFRASMENERKALEEKQAKLNEQILAMKEKPELQTRNLQDEIRQIVDDTLSRSPKRADVTGQGFSTMSFNDDVDGSERIRLSKEKLNKMIEDSRQQREALHGIGSISGILEKHSVDDSLILELNRMAASSVTRDALIQHVKAHFPEKNQDEWNDIVVASLSTQRRSSRRMATEHSRIHETDVKRARFDRSKTSFEAKKQSMQ